MSIARILLVVLIFLALGGSFGGYWPHAYGFGGGGLLLLILLVILLT